jgi:hypothetical protein
MTGCRRWQARSPVVVVCIVRVCASAGGGLACTGERLEDNSSTMKTRWMHERWMQRCRPLVACMMLLLAALQQPRHATKGQRHRCTTSTPHNVVLTGPPHMYSVRSVERSAATACTHRTHAP